VNLLKLRIWLANHLPKRVDPDWTPLDIQPVPDSNFVKHHCAFLGKRVRIRLSGIDDPDGVIIVRGKLLGFGEDGTFEVQEDDGFVHYCWPLLDIEADCGELRAVLGCTMMSRGFAPLVP
jgi:hypothetical protein